MNTHFTARIGRFLAAAVLSVSFILVSACSDDSPANQNPSGLYTSGTGTLNNTSVSDIVGFVHNKRLLAFSITANTLIDGTITSVSETNYNATVRVYTNGVLNQSNVSVTGTVTHGSRITGTLRGTTGTADSGDFSITFDPLYNRGATNARIFSYNDGTTPWIHPWAGPVSMVIPDMLVDNFTVYDNNDYDLNPTKDSPLTTCFNNGTITIPNSSVNIYLLAEVIAYGGGLVTCDTALEADDFTGFAAVVDGTNTDDTLLYAITNASHAVFAVLTKTVP